jgi:outer membrane lipoprotein-sorting protein
VKLSWTVVALGVVCCRLAAGESVSNAPLVRSESEADAEIRRIERQFSGVTNVYTRFIQGKTLAVLQQKIEITGVIAMQQPDRLAWHVEAPMRYSLVMSGNSLRQWDEASQTVQHTTLSRNPILQVVAEQLRQWFSGRYAALSDLYSVRLTGRQPTVLEFSPKADTPAQKAIRKVTVTFRADECYLQAIRIDETSGDSTEMIFVETQINAPLERRLWEVRPGER